MQTKEQFKRRFEDLLTAVSDSMRINAIHLFGSGGVDPGEYDNDYELPKIILTVCLLTEADRWYPRLPKGKAEVKNLEAF